MSTRSRIAIWCSSAFALFLLVSPCWAAITEAALTVDANTTDATSWTTASITPTADRLVILVVINSHGTSATTPTASGNGLTYVEIATLQVPGSTRRVTMFRAMGASPTSGAITIDFGATTQTGCAWSVFEFAGVDTSGTNGSGAVVQSATNTAASGSTSITVTLAAFGSTDNGAAYGQVRNQNEVSAEDTGWTEIHDTGYGTPATSIETQWIASNDTTAGSTWVTTSVAAAIAIEIKASTARRVFLVQ